MDSQILGGVNLDTFGFIAGQHENSNISLVGHCDMPARLGITYHSWAEEKSVEPYVLAEQMIFGGRDIKLVGYIKAQGQVLNLIDLADSFTDLVEYSCKWGIYRVKVGAITVVRHAEELYHVTINMREPVTDMPMVLPTTDAARFGIDSISFEKLGGALLKVTGDIRNRPNTKQEDFTAYGKEGYQITKTEAPILDIELVVKGANYSDFKGKINKLQALLASAGTRLINIPNNTIREFFVTEGFKVTNMHTQPTFFFGIVNIKAIELFGVEERMGYLTDNSGNYITDNYNNKIKGYGGY